MEISAGSTLQDGSASQMAQQRRRRQIYLRDYFHIERNRISSGNTLRDGFLQAKCHNNGDTDKFICAKAGNSRAAYASYDTRVEGLCDFATGQSEY
jgi:hypothetical protein